MTQHPWRTAIGLTLGVVLLFPEGTRSMQERKVVKDGEAADAASSPAIVAGGFVFVSGVIAPGDGGRLEGVDVQAQTRQALQQLKGRLDAAGSSLAQVVSVSVFLKRAADFQPMNDIYRDFFSDSPPTRTTVVTDVRDGALVEVSAIAVPVGVEREVLHPAGWMKSPRPYSYIVRANGLVFSRGSSVDEAPTTSPCSDR